MNVFCPHCGCKIQIIELNCRVFRCGIYKSNGKQLDPHALKELCDKVAKDGLVYGCAKPFEIINDVAVKCDYK